MSEAMEALEHAEHASHAAGHGHGDENSSKAPAKLIGLTMALIGVLIAFCAAMVGGERNELTRSMIEQTQANSNATSASIKFRLIMLDMEQMRGASAAAGVAATTNATLPRFLKLYQDYAQERKLSQQWADSYAPLVDAHFDSAEGYEHAQLIAEIGIVLASLGVLLGSRPAWYVSLIFAVICVAQLGRVYLHTKHEVEDVSVKVKHSEEAYAELRKKHSSSNADELTVDALDPGGKLRAELAGAESGHKE